MANNDPFWARLNAASATSEGFTVNFWMKGGGPRIMDVATSPDISTLIEGERITSEGHRLPVCIRAEDVMAYEIEES